MPSSARPQSPSSVRGILYPIPSVCPSVQQAFAATKSLFSNPLSNVPNQICSKGKVLHNFAPVTTSKQLVFKPYLIFSYISFVLFRHFFASYVVEH